MNFHNVRMHSELSVNNATFTLFINKMLEKRKEKYTQKKYYVLLWKTFWASFPPRWLKWGKLRMNVSVFVNIHCDSNKIMDFVMLWNIFKLIKNKWVEVGFRPLILPRGMTGLNMVTLLCYHLLYISKYINTM